MISVFSQMWPVFIIHVRKRTGTAARMDEINNKAGQKYKVEMTVGLKVQRRQSPVTCDLCNSVIFMPYHTVLMKTRSTRVY